MKVKVGISNNHVHLTKEDLNIIYNRDLTVRNILSEKSQFASNETVTLKTAKDEIKNVRIIGPCRGYTQVEISKTTAHKLGLNPPVRTSGNLEGAEKITIIGPNGQIERNACILAERHIHIPNTLKDKINKDMVDVVIETPDKSKKTIFCNVKFKSSEDDAVELHLDTDDANAVLINQGDFIEIDL